MDVMKNKNYDEDAVFKTSDTTLAAALKTVGYELISTQKTGKITEFVFPLAEDVEVTVRNYYNKLLKGDLYSMGNELKLLKRMIHE